MKKFRKILCVAALCLAMAFTSACTFFETEEDNASDAVGIANIELVRNEDETGYYLVVEYTDGGSARFAIPDAPAGNGIDYIKTDVVDGNTVVTVYYTDTTLIPDEIVIPNGRFISDVQSEPNGETGGVTLRIFFSDGSEPYVLELQPGLPGDRISRIEYEENPVTGEIIVHFFYERYDREEGWVEYELENTVTMPRGRGIVRMTPNYQSYSDPNNIYFDVIYSDGTSETLIIPRANSWYTGEGEPSANQYNIGDFYFDTANYSIWHKELTGWKKIADFSQYKSDYEDHYVYFFNNDGGDSASSVSIPHGYTFAAAGKTLDVPEREGYRFLGWYTDADVNNVNAGHFTDLTPVFSNLYLYARWEKLPAAED